MCENGKCVFGAGCDDVVTFIMPNDTASSSISGSLVGMATPFTCVPLPDGEFRFKVRQEVASDVTRILNGMGVNYRFVAGNVCVPV